MKYKLLLRDGTSVITEKEESETYKNIVTLQRYHPEDFETVIRINDCADCVHISTPKGKQCYTISRMIKEKIRNKGLPLNPIIVIPLLDELGENCKRYKIEAI